MYSYLVDCVFLYVPTRICTVHILHPRGFMCVLRYEIVAGRIRKVPRDERGGGDGGGGGSGGGGPSSKSRSASPEDGGCAASSDGCVHVFPPVPPGPPADLADDTAVFAVDEAGRPAPPGPPGPYWIEYQHEGIPWFFYEGPLGQWWVDSLGEPPIPFCLAEQTDP